MRHQSRPLVPRLSICLLLLAGSTQSLAEEPDPAHALAGMLGKFDAIHASFIQMTLAADDKTQSGEFWLQKPDKFRVETGPPLSQTVVSDGDSLWTHDRDLEQVIITRFKADAALLPVLLLASSADEIANAFSVDRYADGNLDQEGIKNTNGQRIRFLLTPYNENSILTSVAIVFEGSVPRSITLEDAMQQHSIIKLFAVDLAPDLTGTEFLFEIPESADVIDDRNECSPAPSFLDSRNPEDNPDDSATTHPCTNQK